jgi:hypothetical protein
MPQQHDLELLSKEDRVILAIESRESNRSLTLQRAALLYNVHESTLRHLSRYPPWIT